MRLYIMAGYPEARQCLTNQHNTVGEDDFLKERQSPATDLPGYQTRKLEHPDNSLLLCSADTFIYSFISNYTPSVFKRQRCCRGAKRLEILAVILSAAKDLCVRRARPFTALSYSLHLCKHRLLQYIETIGLRLDRNRPWPCHV